MNLKVRVVLIVLCALLCAAIAFAQGEKVIYTTDGDKFTGTITKQDDKFITLRLEGGTATIPVSIVEKINDLVPEAKLQLVVVHDTKLASRLHEELRCGRDFAELVEKYSQHITYFTDGKTGFVEKGYLPEKVAGIAFSLPEDRYTSPLNAGDAFYMVKVLEKRKTEKEKPGPGDVEKPQGQGDSQEEPKPEEPAAASDKSPVRIAVLPPKATTHEARIAGTAAKVQEQLVSEISATTGFNAFMAAEAPKPDDENTPEYVITGEVAKAGPARSLQLVLKNKSGQKLLTTDRLTSVGVDDFLEAIEILADAVVREIQKPR